MYYDHREKFCGMQNPFEPTGRRGRRPFYSVASTTPKALDAIAGKLDAGLTSSGPQLQYSWQSRFSRPDFLVPPNSSGYKPMWDFRTGTDDSTASNAEQVVKRFEAWREENRKQALISHIWKPHPSSLNNDPYNNSLNSTTSNKART